MHSISSRRRRSASIRAAVALILTLVSVGAFADAFPGRTFSKVGDMAMPAFAAGYGLAEVPAERSAVLFGGGDQYSNWSNAVRRYSIATNTWEILPVTLPYAWFNNERFGAALASNGKYYVCPGNGPGGWGQHDRIIEVDLTANTAVERAPVVAVGSHIWGIAVAPAPASRGGVYLFGGWNGGGIGAIRHYDPATDTMTTIGSLSVGRTLGARVLHPNGRIYLFGGNYPTSTVDVFDTATETVRPVANPTGFLFHHGTHGWVGMDGFIYLWNPIDPNLGSGSGCVIRFDPATETFESLGATPGAGIYVVDLIRDPLSDDVYSIGIMPPSYIWGVYGQLVGEVWKLAPADTTPPVIAAPPDVTAYTGVGASTCSTVINDATLAAATATNDGGPVPVTRSGVPAGNLFAVGTTTLTYTATDAAGNTATASQTITVVDNTLPQVTAPPDVVVYTGPGATSCGVTVTAAQLGSASANDNCGIASIASNAPAANQFGVGTTNVIYSATDIHGNVASATQKVTVIDNTPPVIAGVSASPSILWPPNHQMVDVTVSFAASDNCVGVLTALEVSSSEPQNGLGDGDQAPDWVVLDEHHVRLRAERAGMGAGRTYTITIHAIDAYGNDTAVPTTVFAPKSQK